jgi:hypothetical protein
MFIRSGDIPSVNQGIRRLHNFFLMLGILIIIQLVAVTIVLIVFGGAILAAIGLGATAASNSP